MSQPTTMYAEVRVRVEIELKRRDNDVAEAAVDTLRGAGASLAANVELGDGRHYVTPHGFVTEILAAGWLEDEAER